MRGKAWTLLLLVILGLVMLKGWAHWRGIHLEVNLALRSEADLAVSPTQQENGWPTIDWNELEGLLRTLPIDEVWDGRTESTEVAAFVRAPDARKILTLTDRAMRFSRFVDPSHITDNMDEILTPIQRLESLDVQAMIANGSALQAVVASRIRLRAWIDLASNGRSFWAQLAGFRGTKLTAAALEAACQAAQSSEMQPGPIEWPAGLADPARFVVDPAAPDRLMSAGYLYGAEQTRNYFHKHRLDIWFAILNDPASTSEKINRCFSIAQSGAGDHDQRAALPPTRDQDARDARLVRAVCTIMKSSADCAHRMERELAGVQGRIEEALGCVDTLQQPNNPTRVDP